MTSVLEMTVEELKRKIEKLRDLGWVRSYRKGNTGVGHTMEGLLGYGLCKIIQGFRGELTTKSES